MSGDPAVDWNYGRGRDEFETGRGGAVMACRCPQLGLPYLKSHVQNE